MNAVSRWFTMVWTGFAITIVGLSMLLNKSRVTPAQRKNFQQMRDTWRAKFGTQAQ